MVYCYDGRWQSGGVKGGNRAAGEGGGTDLPLALVI